MFVPKDLDSKILHLFVLLNYFNGSVGFNRLALLSSNGYGDRGLYFLLNCFPDCCVVYSFDCFLHFGCLFVGLCIDLLEISATFAESFAAWSSTFLIISALGATFFESSTCLNIIFIDVGAGVIGRRLWGP